jgi:hypothetical protein
MIFTHAKTTVLALWVKNLKRSYFCVTVVLPGGGDGTMQFVSPVETGLKPKGWYG